LRNKNLENKNNLNISILLFLFWIALLSFLTVNIINNSDSIEKINEKL